MGKNVIMPAQDTAGIVLADRYTLKSEIGKGGMGVVWRARDNLLERDVAIKEVRLPTEVSGGDRATMHARVMREARAAARMSHPAVVTVYDVLSDQGRTYIVMELVDAPTLADVVARDGPMPPERVAALGLEILGALEKAHAEGIVHRDVKPQNVMVSEEGRAKLADFGIASLKGDPKLTATGILLGSPSYMAPEQAQGDDSGPPADLWALGATLYYAVEGQAPFDRGQPIPTLAAVVYDDPRPPQRAGALGPILMALLRKSPSDRPAGTKLRSALSDVAGRRGSVATTPIPAAEQVWTTRGEPLGRLLEFERRPSRSSLRWALVALAGLVALAIGLLLLQSPPEPKTSGRVERAQADPARGSGRDGRGGGQTETSNDAVETPPQTQTGSSNDAVETQAGGSGIPSDWVTYEDPATGFRISHPPDWSVDLDSRDSDSIDIMDPNSGTYLRVDWTDEPRGSPVAAWRALAKSFAATHENYQEIEITPTEFKGYSAAVWEFTYSQDGADLHAVDLGFVTGEYGFALFFQTHVEDWEESQDLFTAFQASFQAPD